MKHLLMLFAISTLFGCQKNHIDTLSIGFSTPEGNAVWVYDASFDNGWNITAGKLDCCWKEAHSVNGVFNNHPPKQLSLRWKDLSQDVIYDAQIDLSVDFEERLQALPAFTVVDSGKRISARKHLIIGIHHQGQVEVWLSNSRSHKNVKGRVLHTVGRAAANIHAYQQPKSLRRTHGPKKRVTLL